MKENAFIYGAKQIGETVIWSFGKRWFQTMCTKEFVANAENTKEIDYPGKVGGNDVNFQADPEWLSKIVYGKVLPLAKGYSVDRGWCVWDSNDVAWFVPIQETCGCVRLVAGVIPASKEVVAETKWAMDAYARGELIARSQFFLAM